MLDSPAEMTGGQNPLTLLSLGPTIKPTSFFRDKVPVFTHRQSWLLHLCILPLPAVAVLIAMSYLRPTKASLLSTNGPFPFKLSWLFEIFPFGFFSLFPKDIHQVPFDSGEFCSSWQGPGPEEG